jgi:hypothetical protein
LRALLPSALLRCCLAPHPAHAAHNESEGVNSLNSIVTGGGDYNAGYGYYAGYCITTGSDNTAVGYGAMTGVSATPLTGQYNTAVGQNEHSAA